MKVDLDDTAQCPIEPACTGCGAEGVVLDVTTMEAQVGVFCVTLCPTCDPTTWETLPLSWATTKSLEHCEHLGITADTMAEAMEAER